MPRNELVYDVGSAPTSKSEALKAQIFHGDEGNEDTAG